MTSIELEAVPVDFARTLERELAIAENWVEHHSKHADDLIGENDRLRAEVERLKVEDTDWELAFQAATQLIADSEAELAAANKRIADCEFLLEHRYKIIQQQEPRCNEAIARAEKAEAERDRADAEVAALKKVLLEFGQLPSTQP
jgi:chromosome segregation ATPase